MALVDDLDDLLPQTQCGQCGYDGCRPYADAMARGEATHNLCPPGGKALEKKLAERLGKPSLTLATPAKNQPGQRLEAVIREDECIGCVKCAQACPTDAIVGARQFMHTVISHECTGCELCVEPCPVDCIDMVLRPTEEQTLSDAERFHARDRYQARERRLITEKQRDQKEREYKRQRRAANKPIKVTPESELNQIKAAWQRTKTQHKQLQTAIGYIEKRGQQPAPEHLQQLDSLQAQMAQLKQQLDLARGEAPENNAHIDNLKKAATRSELAWRHAQAKGISGNTLAQLKQQRDDDQQRLDDAINS